MFTESARYFECAANSLIFWETFVHTIRRKKENPRHQKSAPTEVNAQKTQTPIVAKQF